MNSLTPNPISLLAAALGISATLAALLIALLAAWTLIWKGLGLWRAARNEQKWWFLAFLIINDLGILEIIYLLWFRNDKDTLVTSGSEATTDAS